jgi:hypothetical protein
MRQKHTAWKRIPAELGSQEVSLNTWQPTDAAQTSRAMGKPGASRCHHQCHEEVCIRSYWPRDLGWQSDQILASSPPDPNALQLGHLCVNLSFVTKCVRWPA